VDYFNHLGSITNDAIFACEITSRIAIAKAAFSRKKTLFTRKMDLNLRKKPVEFYVRSIALHGVGN
jgi:hypothetical protein